MEKRRILFLLLLAVILLLSGSLPRKTVHLPPETVTRVEVLCRNGSQVLERCYLTPSKIRPMLSYLRLLRYCGRADVPPENLAGTDYLITLSYSSGRRQTYYQRADRFLYREGQSWQLIDPQQAKFLYPLLQAIPGD